MYFLHKAHAIIVGSLLLSIGINLFLVPFNLLDGGVIGIGLIIKYLFGIKAGLTIIVVSIPIFIFAWYHYRTLFYNSLHWMLISSFLIDLLSPLHRYIHSYVELTSMLSSI